MKHTFSFLVLFFFIQFTGLSQYTEVGVFAGVSNYKGDLAPNFMEVQGYAPAFGAFGRYNFTGHFSVKMHFYKGILKGTDAYSQITKGNRARNLSFRTDLYELGLQVEYNFLNYDAVIGNHVTTPYVFGGVAGFYFNPQAEYDGQWFDLQPLGTEGQGLEGYASPYQKFSLGIPMGFGVKFNLSHSTNIGLEVGMRKTFTDYIDDVSTVYPDLNVLNEEKGGFAAALSYRTPEYDPKMATDPTGLERGDAKLKDWYFFGGVTISVNIGKASGFENRQKRPRSRRKPKMEF
ncbi:MAG TPA: hypothetical protein ENJ53_04170 [Phaeodactylibacter sp.]|nr:hypothetical protein [Phaeodactylibacter sp.]